MTSSNVPASFARPWKQTLELKKQEQANDFPNYHLDKPECLVTDCTPRSIRVGPGVSIYKDSLLPAIASAKQEVILVTCFWAKSPTLAALKETLEELAETRRAASGQGGASQNPLRIQIGFSSRSPFQKLFHTWSRDGHLYPAKSWPKLGLPDEKLLRDGNIEMTVKSLFFLPFSVMHPKFLIVDRRRAWMPSCNVSWEVWFETCVEFDGPAVARLVDFYNHVWDRKDGSKKLLVIVSEYEENQESQEPQENQGRQEHAGTTDENGSEEPSTGNSAKNLYRFSDNMSYPTILLPSSHHRNPRFRFLPFLRPAPPPTTPLNTAVLTLIENAEQFIQITTPNLTCEAVISHLLSALQRGVTVHIRTSRNLMVLEQLVTAFTTTSWCIKSLIKRYRKLCSSASTASGDVEEAPLRPGHLKIMYYRPDPERKVAGDEEEPAVSHVKMVQVDGEYLVLGSGNMDRASWYTSQELGIMFYMPGLELDVWSKPLETRLEVIFEG